MEEINLRKKPNEEMHISIIHEEIPQGKMFNPKKCLTRKTSHMT